MRIRFRRVKDIVTVPVDRFIRATAAWPRLQRTTFGALGLLMKAGYFVPGSHLRRTTRDFCRATGQANPRAICFGLIDNGMRAIATFGRLHRSGAEAIAEQVTLDDACIARIEKARAQFGTVIVVVPHCAGSVLSAAGIGRRYPTVVLVRESKSPHRSAILRQYFDKLGTDLFFVRRTDPTVVARGILRALHDRKLVVGTTDLLRKTDDTVEATMFGRRVTLPAWPARFSARRKVPILPAYIRMEQGRIVLVSGEAYIDDDLTAATQRWADFFERNIRQSPTDWMFMFDKRWSQVLANAARPRDPLTAGPSDPSAPRAAGASAATCARVP